MLLTDAVIELRYAKDWTKESVRWYSGRLRLFMDWAATQGVTTLEDVTPMLVRRYMAYLQERPRATGKLLDSHTVHGHIRIIRTLLFWAASEELIDESIPRRIKPPRKEKKVVRVLTAQQIDLLFEAAKHTTAPLRNTALLYLLLDTGCRASELCGLLVDNVIFEADRAYIIVYGKGRKQRPIKLGKKARLALARYLHRERQASESETHVFVGERGPLSAEGLERLLYRLRASAGADHFTGVPTSPHRWRHTCAVMKRKAGEDVHAIQKDLGHAGIGITENYLKGLLDSEAMEMSVSPLDSMGKLT